MTGVVRARPFEPFYLAAQQGRRFCIYHPAAGAPRGNVVYVHPFAEEMNKSRRMAALQSRALAAAGFSVLQIDLFGCGDSSGEFVDARWEIWRQDIALGVKWINERADGGLTLWGLRLGALLALDAAKICKPLPRHFVLWQPALSGELLLTQFLRLRLASEMMSGGSAKSGLGELRDQLSSGRAIEIAGYELSPQLAARMNEVTLSRLAPSTSTVHWFEVVPEPGRDMPPAARRVTDAWINNRIALSAHCVHGPSFWNTVETAECPELISATSNVMRQGAS